jgi:hypothetical protein
LDMGDLLRFPERALGTGKPSRRSGPGCQAQSEINYPAEKKARALKLRVNTGCYLEITLARQPQNQKK